MKQTVCFMEVASRRGGPGRALLLELQDPGRYPPPRPSRVEVRETHLSWVFLTDREAWKVKRPVHYGFVDYTTPEKRRHFCREEIRLGRRLAPGVYWGIARLWRGPRGHSFLRTGRVVDYAVRMKRLPDEATAEARLDAGTLSGDALDRLAGMLAVFYASSAIDPSFDFQDALRQNVRENFQQVEPFVGRLLGKALFRDVRAWQEESLARHAPRFALRTSAGRVREGHGDLRLEHVYLLEDGPVVLDPIEFTPRFRFGDVALDASFLAMDLSTRGAGRLGDGFLGEFALASNDYGFYPLLDFYLSYRAWVRGKVACFVAADPATPPSKRARKREEAARLFAQSRSFMRGPRGTPRLVVVGGLIGSGKSTLARELRRRWGVPVVASDPTRKSLAGIPPTQAGPPRLYRSDFSERVYRELFRRAEDVLSSGRSVVLDATFAGRRRRLEARSLAARYGAPFLFVETSCPEAVLRQRLRQRAAGPSVSDAREELLGLFRSAFQPVDELKSGEYLRLDGTRPPEDLVRDIEPRLRK
jgi:hypothetical protein